MLTKLDYTKIYVLYKKINFNFASNHVVNFYYCKYMWISEYLLMYFTFYFSLCNFGKCDDLNYIYIIWIENTTRSKYKMLYPQF